MGLGTHDSHENSQNSKNSGAHKDSDDALAKAQAVSQDAAGLNGCQTKTRTDPDRALAEPGHMLRVRYRRCLIVVEDFFFFYRCNILFHSWFLPFRVS